MAIRNELPNRAGAGLKPAHYRDVLDRHPDIGWFEVHPENYMGAGGPPHAYLTRIRECYPLSLHGVGLSIGGAAPLDDAHLARLKALIDRYEPASVSEHLAWSTHQGQYFNDLLALPYNAETLSLVAEHVDHVQTALGRRILIENPSTYVAFDESDMTEIEFIRELVRRSGCGLLLDVNNVFVSCTNRGDDANAYIDVFPIDRVEEIHLAGHAADADADGRPLLVDTHDREVSASVWSLYERALTRSGALPTLIEWDGNVPDWTTLHTEAQHAETRLAACATVTRHVA